MRKGGYHVSQDLQGNINVPQTLDLTTGQRHHLLTAAVFISITFSLVLILPDFQVSGYFSPMSGRSLAVHVKIQRCGWKVRTIAKHT